MATNAELQSQISALNSELATWNTTYATARANLTSVLANGAPAYYNGTFTANVDEYIKGFTLNANKCSHAACMAIVGLINKLATDTKNAYDKINILTGQIAELQKQLSGSPQTQANVAAATQIETGKNIRWIFFGITVLIILATGAYLFLRTGIKKWMIFTGGIALIVGAFFIFNSIKK